MCRNILRATHNIDCVEATLYVYLKITIEYPFANFTVQWRGIPLPRLLAGAASPLLLEVNNWYDKMGS